MADENIGVHIKRKRQMRGEQPTSPPQHRPASPRRTFAFVSDLVPPGPREQSPRQRHTSFDLCLSSWFGSKACISLLFVCLPFNAHGCHTAQMAPAHRPGFRQRARAFLSRSCQASRPLEAESVPAPASLPASERPPPGAGCGRNVGWEGAMCLCITVKTQDCPSFSTIAAIAVIATMVVGVVFVCL